MVKNQTIQHGGKLCTHTMDKVTPSLSTSKMKGLVIHYENMLKISLEHNFGRAK
jgi:hypothetical protein